MHKFSDSPAQNWENPVLLLENSLKRCPFSPLPYGCEMALPQAKTSVKCSFWNNSSLNVPESCFSARLSNDPISWAASNHKMSEALSSQKTRWSLSLLLSPQILPSTKSHQQNATNLDSTALHPSKHLTKLDLIKAGSLDDWKKFLQLLWNGWSLSFLQLIRKYLFKSEIVSWSVMSNSLWPHEV